MRIKSNQIKSNFICDTIIRQMCRHDTTALTGALGSQGAYAAKPQEKVKRL